MERADLQPGPRVVIDLAAARYHLGAYQHRRAMSTNELAAPAASEGDGYNVFLSYRSGDAAAVSSIADYLRQQGLPPFLDRWYFTPGQQWVSGMPPVPSPASSWR